MKDKKLAEFLEQNEKNLSWEEAVKKVNGSGKVNSKEDVFNSIILKAKSGREPIDDLFKIQRL